MRNRLATPDQIKNYRRGDDEDCGDAGLHARMPVILGCSRAIFFADFGKCKILEGKTLAK